MNYFFFFQDCTLHIPAFSNTIAAGRKKLGGGCDITFAIHPCRHQNDSCACYWSLICRGSPTLCDFCRLSIFEVIGCASDKLILDSILFHQFTKHSTISSSMFSVALLSSLWELFRSQSNSITENDRKLY